MGENVQVSAVGHNWGAIIAWYFSLFRPDRVKALVALDVPFQPRFPLKKPTDKLRAVYSDDYYIIRFQEPGEMEAKFASVGTKTVLKKFLTYRDPGPLMIPTDKGFAPNGPITLPCWLSEKDIDYYTTKYEKTGFTGGFNYY
ncbi:hypothetical protein GIB67_031558 [Kingdonia uniflora]|uniref:AB hydrolase-1 domain-containing protein n=1 Tax=Kingdonia uniflora TaxID=39325 RepID=A0A7J7PBE1_9MAGN|nr:hypothetical protein GIB67_031558 [Kingdonia uniflora]